MSTSENNATVAREMLEAFQDKDRAKAEKLIAQTFAFTSPYDDAIDRAAFFARCWPNNERLKEMQIERVAGDTDGAFVTYLFITKDGISFRNTEYLTVLDGQITKDDVYFGASYKDGRFVAKKSE